jgi:hypothetical protein
VAFSLGRQAGKGSGGAVEQTARTLDLVPPEPGRAHLPWRSVAIISTIAAGVKRRRDRASSAGTTSAPSPPLTVHLSNK